MLRRPGLASARTKDGSEIVGKRDVLSVPGREIRWEEILNAEWDSETDTLVVMLVEPEVLSFELDEPALLLQLVRERVTASVVLTRRFLVEGKLGFTVMARRPPSGGEITLTYEYDRGLDPDAPAVREAAQSALRDVRDELGL
jgi:hypothetical protein